MADISRRAFLEKAGVGASLATLAATGTAAIAEEAAKPSALTLPTLKKKYRAAIIGSTGHGDYGHEIDHALVKLPGIEFVAIADDNATGLKEAGKRCNVTRLYEDYRKMLEAEQVDLVAVGMRHIDRHEEVITHCAGKGKHVYSEKPLAGDLPGFDRIERACDKAKVKLGVALPNRFSPAVKKVAALIHDGKIGKVQSILAQGKCDDRGGGEDLVVLGFHMLDLMNMFAGTPQWTFAQVQQGNADATKQNARAASEPVGPVAGDCVVAMFGYPDQVHGYFQSHRNTKPSGDRFSLEIRGSEGIVMIRNLTDVVWFRGLAFNPAKPVRWQTVQIPEWDAMDAKTRYNWCHQRAMLDVLAAAEENREPGTGLHHVKWVQEMLQSIYASHLAQARVALPLEERSHPLT